jgi:hypothetical protein
MDRSAATELDAPPCGPSFAAGLAQVVAGLDQILAAVPGFDTDPAPADGLLPPGYRCESMNGHPIDPATAIAAALIGHVRRVVIDERSVVIDQSRKMRLFRDNAAIAARMTATTPRRLPPRRHPHPLTHNESGTPARPHGNGPPPGMVRGTRAAAAPSAACSSSDRR